MDLTKTNKLATVSAAVLMFGAGVAAAADIETNMARMQAMDKITGKVSEIDVPVNGEADFGTFSVVVRRCVTRSPEETPENTAFVDVVDNYKSENPVNIFKGWMFSSSPALNAVEHPIYDVWLLKCYDGDLKDKKLLSEEQLAARDEIPMQEIQVPVMAAELPITPSEEETAPAKETQPVEEPSDGNIVEMPEQEETEAKADISDAAAVAEVIFVEEDGAPKPLLRLQPQPQQPVPSENAEGTEVSQQSSGEISGNVSDLNDTDKISVGENEVPFNGTGVPEEDDISAAEADPVADTAVSAQDDGTAVSAETSGISDQTATETEIDVSEPLDDALPEENGLLDDDAV